MSRIALTRPRRNRAVWDRPAHDTRLLPTLFPDTVSPSYPTSGDGRSIDSTRHTYLLGYSRVYAPFMGRPAPAMCKGLCPDFVGSPEAIAPRVYSPVASLGTPLSHGDGKEDAPDPLRTVESVWGLPPFLDSPVFPLGESPSPRDGSGSALPSLRLVERFPHTDRPQRATPSRPVPSRVWRRLAPHPTRLGHGPSIAYPSLLPFQCPARSKMRLRRESIPVGGAAHYEALEACPEPRRRGPSGGRPGLANPSRSSSTPPREKRISPKTIKNHA